MIDFRSLSSAKVGERLQYGYHGFGEYLPTAIVKVTEVGKNYIKTDDGKKWKTGDGREWGEKYRSVSIGFITPESESSWDEIRERRTALAQLIPLIEGRWERNLSAQQVRAIVAILKPSDAKEDAA